MSWPEGGVHVPQGVFGVALLFLRRHSPPRFFTGCVTPGAQTLCLACLCKDPTTRKAKLACTGGGQGRKTTANLAYQGPVRLASIFDLHRVDQIQHETRPGWLHIKNLARLRAANCWPKPAFFAATHLFLDTFDAPNLTLLDL